MKEFVFFLFDFFLLEIYQIAREENSDWREEKECKVIGGIFEAKRLSVVSFASVTLLWWHCFDLVCMFNSLESMNWSVKLNKSICMSMT